MSQPSTHEILAAQQDTLDELTATVARLDRTVQRLTDTLAAHGITVDLDDDPDGQA